MLTDERIAEIRARLPYYSYANTGRETRDVADLLQHADALAEENRRLRAALTTLAQPPARELSPYTRDPEVSARMEAARRALEETT